MKLEMIRLEVADYVAVVTMDRAPVNAMNAQFRRELIDVFDAITDRDDVRCAVLTGRENIFSAGADLKERIALVKEPGDYSRNNRLAREMGNAIRECAKPVIAAVNGAALGAGLGLMVACDIIFASDNAVAGMPEIDVGLAGGAAMLNAVFPRSMARRMFFTGWRVPAEELARRGIIEASVPRGELMAAAMAVAREIAGKSPTGMAAAKWSFNTIESMPARDGYRHEQNVTVSLSTTPDTKEAQRAFVEKRKAVFGRPA